MKRPPGLFAPISQKISYPSTINTGQAFAISGEWLNRGVGRAMRSYSLRLSLVDEGGTVISTAEAGSLGADKWVKGETYMVESRAMFKDIKAGDYALHFGVVDAATLTAIRLPLKAAEAGGRYRIGEVTVAAP